VFSSPESKQKPPCLARIRSSELENRLMGRACSFARRGTSVSVWLLFKVRQSEVYLRQCNL
jgi:hypothetical protein